MIKRMRAPGGAGRGPGARTRAALYLRVSTGGQSAANQRPACVQIVRARGLELVATYTEQASGAARVRVEFNRMIDDAKRGAFDVLVVWALDRFGRSMIGNLTAVLELERVGVQVISVREPWLDTGPMLRPLLIAIVSWVAEQERARLGERTRAGLDRARAKGKTLGRPRARVNLALARSLRAEGHTWREVARRMGISEATLGRALR